METFILAANWKMNKGPSEAVSYLKEFLSKWTVLPRNKTQNVRPLFFVPALDLWVVQEVLRNTPIAFGAQNSFYENQGAFTGENSPQILFELGCKVTLVGHSERRTIFKETDNETAGKVKILQSLGIEPMLCVGETLEEREKAQTEAVIVRQLRAGLAHADLTRPFTIAYEPVWAIGTGKVATPQQANEAHSILRETLRNMGGASLADHTAILYGGSVKAENAADIRSQPQVNGFLVGGASLQVDSFLALL